MNSDQSFWTQNPVVIFLKKRIPIAHFALILLLIGVIVIGAIPGYLSGKWSWTDIPKVANIEPLKNIRQEGLSVPGWKTLTQKTILIGGNQWSQQLMAQDQENPVTVLLMPQSYYKNKPEVEWNDLNALEHWKRDSDSSLKFEVKNASGNKSQITARFFRAWKKTTVAVVQWYAWPGGGNYSPSSWFWADQWSQLHQQRLPWVAVCFSIPIDPLSNMKANQQTAISIAQTLQAALEENIFKFTQSKANKN
ncbi:cyanoexosortase B system-associated protein [Gloeothece verrucosa]|uniref:Cyanoexosortase B system-associated protein n=1 Tax=Gloeothece verrucosa (strain PCC 7822) TaxID=497965 RepID=E0UI71_GLOV7|nr:cyanoexosortase B system-associated protein [Gloeothece verrucosa]ADN15723.1 conserved hypothetical protein [Gloeothece verrucosa PCC 7822]